MQGEPGKLDHENFIRENLFLSRIWQNRENILSSKILGYTVVQAEVQVQYKQREGHVKARLGCMQKINSSRPDQ